MNDEVNWNECIETCASVKITPNKPKARSLIDTSRGRIQFLNEIEIKENNANYIFEGCYTSVLEILQALLILEGYKVNNHICLGYYLRDILKRNDLFIVFDSCRFNRNSLVYYGRKMDFETAKLGIEKCKKLIGLLEHLLENKI